MFEFTALNHGFDLRMSTDLLNVDRCIDRMRLFLEERGGSEHLFALSLLAREALNNAMIHGNARSADKAVFFRLRVREGGVDLEIEDEGPGFPWAEHLQAISDVDAERGRGHEIFRHYARAVRYNAKGNALVLEYRGQQ